MFNKRHLVSLFAALALLCSTSTFASLVGDSVDAGIFSFGTRITGFGLDDPYTVAADSTDLQTYSSSFTLDVHGDAFYIDFLPTPGGRPIPWAFGVEFRLFDLDWIDNPSGRITGLEIESNIAEWNMTRAVFGDDFVFLDWNAMFVDGDSFFDVRLLTDHSAVPIPAALWLFASALIGVVGFSRRNHAG